MGRPPIITDEALVDVAHDVFLEYGVEATIAQIAERAGVSEALVFHRFKTKEELFQVAMAVPLDPPWLTNLPGRVGKGVLRDQLTEMTREGLAFFRIMVPVAMMQWSKRGDGTGTRPKMKVGTESPPMRGLRLVGGYFEAEMRLGRMARHDAEVVARTLTGALWEYVSMELMFERSGVLPLPEETFIRSLVHLMLEGLSPRATEKKSR